MRLKRLELFGFKSFADRTVMDFGQTTLTGIVGPNGCGKSNVVDAVRWVLGETRPTSMRGSGMTDVIFKGSASRPAMGTAEVTMVLDNTLPSGQVEEPEGISEGRENADTDPRAGLERNRRLADRGAEVSFTRRLYASGEGEYLIDGEKVRLKDVKDLLFDTGLGSRGYSVLEQGRIDAVLSANPAQRRAIFEEAAGISRYRQRRHETELRLKRCEQDVERLDDLMGELRSRVRSLKIQAGKAEKYVAAKEEWVTGRTRLLSQRLAGYDAELEGLRPRIDEWEEGLDGMRARRAECDGEIEQREEERRRVVESLSKIGDQASQLSGDLRALEERKSQLAMRIASWAASAQEESERAGALADQLAERESELGALTQNIDELRERARNAEERANGLAAQARTLGKSYKGLRTEVQAQNDRVLERLHERTAAENRLVHLDEALPPARERLQRVVQRYSAAEEQLEEASASRELLGAALSGAEASFAEADAAFRKAETDLAGGRERLVGLRSKHAEKDRERAALGSKVEALLDRERELEDLSSGGRRVLEAAADGSGPCHAEDILGLVADHVRVDLRLARAIDAVLGERAHALVARDAHVARRIVDWCNDEEVGQVAVVVPPGVGAPDCPPPSDYALFARFGAGVEGRLGDLVQCDASMKALVHALFCDVVVVSSLDIALDLVGREPGWRFVTPRGELVDSAGLVGGHREVAQGFVGRRSSAAELEERIAALENEIETLDAHIAEATRTIADAASERDDCSVRRDETRAAQADAEAALSALVARLSDLESALGVHGEERSKAEAEVARVEREIGEARETKRRAGEAFETENDKLEQMEKSRRELEAEREDLQREEQRAQVELTSARAELTGLEQRIKSSERLIGETRSEIERSRKRAATYEESAAGGRTEVEGIATEYDEGRSALSEFEERIAGLRAEERDGAARISETRKAAEAVQAELDAQAEKLEKARLEAQKIALARDEVLGRAEEELESSEVQLRQAFDLAGAELEEADVLRQLEKDVAAVKKQLDKLGPVNVEAVHELEEVGGRLEHLETQSADLAEARKTLMDTIRTIDEESRRLFVETFEEVRENFQRIFRLLFGGGKADIRLEEDVDVLDAGVEIVARPPGRELLAIGLLSGGQRTMTALALLFAVFEARPSPFCVLDEVDAALDDANIDRFLGMLETFRKTTQFVVVTHNKGTMAASQALYGVTMQIKGVSRFVAVELDDALELAPEVKGTAGSGATKSARAREASDRPEPESTDDDADEESGEPIKEIRAHRNGTEGSAADRGTEPEKRVLTQPVSD